jgi:hypothetical protein
MNDDTLPDDEGCECPGEHECGASASSPEWIFTFGFGHYHPVTGADLIGRFVRVRAADELAARARMVKHFGVKWAHQYASLAAAGGDTHDLVELPRGEWPPPIAREVEALPNHTIIDVVELEARCQHPPLIAAHPILSYLVADSSYMLRAVLVSGSIGDVAVYLGVGSAEWVADHGAKAPFALARGFFPKLEERLYRP